MSNKESNVDRLLKSVGIETFIKYFNQFQTLNNIELKMLFDQENENWKNTSKTIKASVGKRIFNEGIEVEALEHIMLTKSEKSIPNGPNIIQQAKLIYQNYNESKNIEKVETISSFEKMVLVKYRLQQGIFRKNLLLYWEGCSVTGCKNSSLLIASHIKPFSESFDNEKYDVYNGLLLVPNYDKLFDSLLISFNEAGEILVSKKLKKSDLESLNITGKEKLRIEKVTESTLKYLGYHRKKFEKNELIN
jgi:predicted restriction endonuclease